MESRLVGITTTTTRTMTLLETHLRPTNNAACKPLLTEFPRKTQRQLSNGTVSTEQIATFIGSSSTLMSKLPKSPPFVDLTADIVSSLYLTLQVNAIDKSLFDWSSGVDSYYVAPSDFYRRPFQIQFTNLHLMKDQRSSPTAHNARSLFCYIEDINILAGPRLRATEEGFFFAFIDRQREAHYFCFTHHIPIHLKVGNSPFCPNTRRYSWRCEIEDIYVRNWHWSFQVFPCRSATVRFWNTQICFMHISVATRTTSSSWRNNV